ncbi:hypothetical protein MBEHAL_0631 [Halarchaeum acidiphilum MH1-52-1]|uniref:DUF7847 domain-containing protein n=2 Tax=Halarchaeum acidiphilum TaxID=489138 RepID=U2YDV2_9EURY|nr:hypothetical protein [Halarchaeum acidiphilum]GAD51871.1 hypothetical protein MBEHAL_0631 [Halarchaeum acidiphilum MH1-52-1]
MSVGKRAIVMTLNIGAALEDGLRRSVTRVALAFVAVQFVFQGLLGSFVPTVAVNYLHRYRGRLPSTVALSRTGPALPIGSGVAALLAVVLALGYVFVVAALYRAFVDDAAHVTTDLFTHRALGAFGHLLALGVVTFVVAFVNVVPVLGWVVFVFLAVAFWFAPLRIAAEDDGVVTALKASWRLTRGNRLRLFAIGLAFVVVTGTVVNAVGLAFGMFSAVYSLVNALLSAYFTVLNVAVTAACYHQLVADDAGDDGATDGPADSDDGSVTPQPTAEQDL